ncbi:spore germination protein [Cohnella sp. JJ-181]|uniref:spore germination protein n=1 Tax=Cohnella rhizoplanae TaxID=2974897 RepID=UPI0022FFA6B6|nr:spore germination protein [Cohnella sp. JJ-181]CAI6084983.1 hypothetical protein COHCIP112018_04519 [Cohnella sp. JJ-181]
MQQQARPLHRSSAANIQALQETFSDNASFVTRDLSCRTGPDRAAFAYLDVLVDEKLLHQNVIRKMNEDLELPYDQFDLKVLGSLYSAGKVEVIDDWSAVPEFLYQAGAVLFVDGHPCVYGILMPGYDTRSIGEPKIEVNVRGPRDSFIEDHDKNLSMIYRRLKTSDLKSLSYIIGTQSRTKVTLLYMEGKMDRELAAKLRRKLADFQCDVLLANTQIEELIQDSAYSPFPQIANTERPDRVVTSLSRGKAVILTDGTPIALIAPTTFFEMLHPSEDMYERFHFANFIRIIRTITLFISLFGPSLYIALTTFHLEMIPTPLMMAFLTSKAGIPFPTFVEALIMETAFEILREASLRLPKVVGQSVSIVGALIIGEAAVQSGIVSRPVVIVVAMTGISSFTIPSFGTALSIRLLRFPLMLLASYAGVLGMALGFLVLLLHLCSLHSIGVPYLNPISADGWKKTLQNYVRLPARLRNGTGSREPDYDKNIP